MHTSRITFAVKPRTERDVRVALASTLLFAAGCGVVLNLDNYRDCANPVECAGDASVVADSGDADAFVAPTTCTTSASCTAAAPACSQGVCTAVQSLVRGTVSYQCAILTDQKLWCWGANDHGQLGRGFVGGEMSIPAAVTVLPPDAHVLQAGMGNDFACALTDDALVRCWGEGVAGTGIGTAIKVALANVIELSQGSSGACARLVDKSVHCWGHNDWGDIGCIADADGGLTPSSILAQTPNLLIDGNADIAHVSVGLQSTCVVKNNSDELHCFGNSAWGNLANGVSGGDVACQTGTAKGYGASIARMDSGDFATCAQDANGTFFCWGVNYQDGNHGILWQPDPALLYASPKSIPVPADVGRTTSSISVGWRHSCALLSNGEVICWGDSGLGQAGTYAASAPPSTIAGLKPARDIAAHRHFNCALQNDGQVLCWGANDREQIGTTAKIGASTATPTPVTWH